ncbi:protein translocase subunit SecD [Marinicella gelatinilytica]|uniref:protein translocase subunit SecD n=1 Tax=Marinicella gelatinilytica TaxID=2996017 RepID=UPI002260BDB2|nr:protein translocase subunit SecD [Marinicella gelatinilytica]MCX7544692.1 protein translocase subunit SecD [Marinicella gelatinilytica]
MNRYPLWKYILVLVVVALGSLYALPNIYGQSPIVQVKPDDQSDLQVATIDIIKDTLTERQIGFDSVVEDNGSAIVKFNDLDNQRKAQDVLKEELPGFDTAMNLKPNVPDWLAALGGRAMNLGLDLRGGVHFLLEVDMKEAADNKKKQLRSDITASLIKEKIPKKGIRWDGNRLSIEFRDEATADKALQSIKRDFSELSFELQTNNGEAQITALLTDQSIRDIKENALTQNLTTLRSRVNEIGVAEPIIQRQGVDRIVVQLPGIQDTTRAKNILDATATLEYRATDMENNAVAAHQSGRTPIGSSLFYDRDGRPVLLKDRVIVTGNQLVDANATFDQQSGSQAVSVQINSVGAKRMLEFTKNNVGNNMAVVFKERIPLGKNEEGVMQYKNKEEVISNARINGVFSNRFQTTGLDQKEATELALLLRAGALAAPVQIVEERTIGPSLGQDNIDKGVKSVQIGLVLVVIFMLIYYKMFGVIANIALTINVVLMVACLSLFGATLTLPGIAGIVLTVGMAVDANVLIFERIKEELRTGSSIQSSIKSGYDKAFSTIADANVTTLIAAVVLFAFGTGPIKGFAVTLSIGILTSMFTAIIVSRAIVNLIYGRQKRLKSIAI